MKFQYELKTIPLYELVITQFFILYSLMSWAKVFSKTRINATTSKQPQGWEVTPPKLTTIFKIFNEKQ